MLNDYEFSQFQRQKKIAEEYADLRDWPNALRAYLQLTKITPDSFYGFIMMERVLINMCNPQAARDVLQYASRLPAYRKDRVFWQNIQTAMFEIDAYEQAPPKNNAPPPQHDPKIGSFYQSCLDQYEYLRQEDNRLVRLSAIEYLILQTKGLIPYEAIINEYPYPSMFLIILEKLLTLEKGPDLFAALYEEDYNEYDE